MDRKFWFDVAVVAALTVLAGLLIWIGGELGFFASLDVAAFAWRVVAVVSLVALLRAIWSWLSRFRIAQHQLDLWLQTHDGGTAQGPGRGAATGALDGLPTVLRARHGFRWRYRHPWLLLTGDDATIGRLLPELAKQPWLVTDDAVLLWSKNGSDNRPDENWLTHLYRLRRRRPVDAVVLTLDGTAALPTQRRGTNAHGVNLARIADALRWSAPVYALDVAQTHDTTNGNVPVTGCELFPRDAEARSIEAALMTLRDRLADRSVGQLCRNGRDRYGAYLSQRLDTRAAPLAQWLASLSRRGRQPVSGVFFAPTPATTAPRAARTGEKATSADLPLWRHLGATARIVGGRRTGWHPLTVFPILALTVIGMWSTGMLVAGLTNAHDLHLTHATLQTLATAPDPAARLRALLAVQQRIELYEDRTRHHAPLATRFGLNHDAEVLAALWKPYAEASRAALITPVQQNLEAELVDLGQMQTTQVDEGTSRLALEGHQALKTYLMMADPGRADAAFMTPLLMDYWSTTATLPVGEKIDLSERLLDFYARHLKAHEDWRIQPRADLVNASRQTLLSVIGVKNSEDTVYQRILDSLGNRYTDQTLSSLTAGTDTRGLLHTSATVPGVFTRQAYEGSIAAAIDEAAQHREVAGDWVLANVATAQNDRQQPAQSAGDLKAALTRRYFDDYADHWQGFMNTLQWEPAPTLPAAIGQLKLMADARQSPVIALMKSLEYQAGAGALKASLSDTLVTKAQNVFGGKIEGPQTAKPDPAGPLGVPFGPVLRLIGDTRAQGTDNTAAGVGSTSDLSLQRFMERVTILRLKLQQISDNPDADAHAKQVAQSLFQGKGSELADTQTYAQLVAASLGAQWAGMGDALFVHPVSQATQTVLQPAQASLNEAWQQTIVATWNRSFAGRYPFANTGNDASLPELARFLRPQGGLVTAFLGTQLAGVLELQGDQWVPVATGSTTLTFDPAFLKAINTLQRIAGHLLAQGEPQYRFDFKPVPTPGITDTLFTLDGQKLHYYNQQETWQALTWPSNNPQNEGTRLQWQTETAGTNKSFDFSGRWALVRMLERARIEPVDSATYQLTWQAAPDTKTAKLAQGMRKGDSAGPGDGAEVANLDSLTTQGPLTPTAPSVTYPLRVLMRTDVGKGPLELLALRGFVLPTRIFVGNGPDAVGPGAVRGAKRTAQADGPPPLPRAMLDAAKHAGTPLPGGQGPL